MIVIDISRTLQEDIAVWPGDTPFQLEQMATMAKGDVVNVTTLRLSAHTGTHADAPHHFQDGSTNMAQVALEPYWGPAQVVTVARREGALTVGDFAGVDLRAAPRLLVRSAASQVAHNAFPPHYVYPSPALAAHLGTHGVVLFGSDAPSMDAVDSKDLPGHHALLAQGIAILEGLALAHVADGLYDLVALPLKIRGGDGSPVRAALRRPPAG